MMRTSVIRSSLSSAARISARPAVRFAPVAVQQCRNNSQHALSNPTLANLERRWEEMPPQEQADLWMALRDRMKADWKELTLQEKKAGAYQFYKVHWGCWALG